MQIAHIHTNKHGKYIYRAYIYVCQAIYIYIYMPCIYAYMAIYTLALSPCYIYIYMKHETQKYHAQATSTAGNCSQHGIMIH